MWHPSVIQDINEEFAKAAAKKHKTPFVPTAEDVRGWIEKLTSGQQFTIPFPALGDYVPKGWQYASNGKGDELYYKVDPSFGGGMGVISLLTFLDRILADIVNGHNYGYAIRDQYQFCLDIFAYEREVK